MFAKIENILFDNQPLVSAKIPDILKALSIIKEKRD